MISVICPNPFWRAFNRYMVECEFWMMHLCSRDSCVLIDTWWNVNNAVLFSFSYRSPVLIDTWWNVNFQVTAQLPYR